MPFIHPCLLLFVFAYIQLAEKEGEVGDVNKRLAGLSSELAGERVHLDQLERQEGLWRGGREAGKRFCHDCLLHVLQF